MKLHTINTGFFKLDGGAMFGVVPKTIWEKLNPADENNLCTWAMRCLLIEKDNKLILIDTGLGDKQSSKFFSHFQPHGEDSLVKSINKAGFGIDEITDVVLTHLHFDHCGGAVKWNSAKDGYEPVFKNAIYWTDEAHLHHALNPNPREKASFLSENILPLKENGVLKYINSQKQLIPELSFELYNGHTESMLVPIIQYNGREIAYCADLIPSSSHIPVNYVMSYDIRPLDSMNEKAIFIDKCLDNKRVIMFEHDRTNEACNLKLDDRNRPIVDEFLIISEI